MTQQSCPLFVIEAPGKRRHIRSLLEEIGLYDVRIEATRGRLYDLPKDRLGVDPVGYGILEQVAQDPGKVEYLRQAVASASAVYVMTDDDIEGEVIASQVIAMVGSDVAVHRLAVTSLTASALKIALENPRPLNASSVSGGLARRVYDRMMGYAYGSQNWSEAHLEPQGSVGRILTPVLSEFAQHPQEAGVIQRTLRDDRGQEWQLTLPFTHKERDTVEGYANLLASLPDVEVELKGRVIEADDAEPWSGPEALREISYALDAPVQDVADAMQSLYEDGEISYPRSDSFYLSPETARDMAALAAHFGVSGFDAEHLHEKAKAIRSAHEQGAHEAVAPLTDRLSFQVPLDSLDIKDQVLVLLMRNMLRAGQKDRKLVKSHGRLSPRSPHFGRWQQVLQQWPGRMRVQRMSTFRQGYLKHQALNPEIKPLGHMQCTHQLNDVRVRHYRADWMVLNMMVAHHLGRPSTLPHHASKIARRYLAQDGRLNGYAQSSLQRAALVAPKLMDPELAAAIEIQLHAEGGAPLEERVRKALIASGVAVEALEQAVDLQPVVSEQPDVPDRDEPVQP